MSCIDPVCDFCQHYNFNGDEDGAYTDNGRCEHPLHPHPAEPDDGCPDFRCKVCAKTEDQWETEANRSSDQLEERAG